MTVIVQREIVSLAEYGRRRGVSRPYISRLIREGKLALSVIATPRGNKLDAQIADWEWVGNGIGIRGRANPMAMRHATEANHARRERNEAFWRARLATLEMRRK
jgi:hypothetical protein